MILGISAFYHDSAACIIKDGKILVAAMQLTKIRKRTGSKKRYLLYNSSSFTCGKCLLSF